MKKSQMALFLFLLFNAFQPRSHTVRTQSNNVCKPDYGNVVYATDPDYGFDIIRAEKTYPNYSLIVTQDKNHTGVNIVVEIKSYPGTITYETYDEKCERYDEPQKGMTLCSPYFSAGQYYYLTGTCTPHIDPVYRYIEGTSLKVWLEPSARTSWWLGWSTERLDEDLYPLRYMFPEKWSLGTWTPEGFTTEGDLGLWTEEEIRKFLAEHPGYNFLKADPRRNEIPTQFLTLAENPMQLGGGRVIPLFGREFKAWNEIGTIASDDLCFIDGAGPNGEGYCAKTVNDRTDPLFGSVDLYADNITYLAVSFSHIPMDIPGEWYIAVEVSVRQAIYGGGKLEALDDHAFLTKMPGQGYYHDTPEHTFLTYMWISTPCNLAEVKGCDN
jgi:hypothetical protein